MLADLVLKPPLRRTFPCASYSEGMHKNPRVRYPVGSCPLDRKHWRDSYGKEMRQAQATRQIQRLLHDLIILHAYMI